MDTEAQSPLGRTELGRQADPGPTELGPRASRPHKSWHHRGYVPHFDAAATVQMVTFRLADSLPAAVYREAVATSADGGNRRRRLERMIDEGRGACILRDPENAAIVAEAFFHFDGERYRLLAWVVMPNHVHVLIEQREGSPLGEIISSWKSFTAKVLNRRLGHKGSVWAADYFDRFIRDERHLENAIRTIEENPLKAGLAATPAEWRFSSASD